MCICECMCVCIPVLFYLFFYPCFKIERFLFNFKKHFTLYYRKKSFKKELEDIYCAIYVKHKAHTEIEI